jgi:hypothetical protein
MAAILTRHYDLLSEHRPTTNEKEISLEILIQRILLQTQ